jgi:hypothetical protein
MRGIRLFISFRIIFFTYGTEDGPGKCQVNLHSHSLLSDLTFKCSYEKTHSAEVTSVNTFQQPNLTPRDFFTGVFIVAPGYEDNSPKTGFAPGPQRRT